MMRLAILAALLAAPASAEPQCFPRDDLVTALEREFGETLRSQAYVDGAIAETFAAETGAWTLVITRPDGVSCIMLAGELWTVVVAGDPV